MQLITTLSTNQSLERWNKPPWSFSNFIIRGSPTSTSSMTYVSSWPFSKLLWNHLSKTTGLVRALVPRKRVNDFHHIKIFIQCTNNKQGKYTCIHRSLSVSNNMACLKRKKISIEGYCSNNQGKYLKYACIRQYFQNLGHSFPLYGPSIRKVENDANDANDALIAQENINANIHLYLVF